MEWIDIPKDYKLFSFQIRLLEELSKFREEKLFGQQYPIVDKPITFYEFYHDFLDTCDTVVPTPITSRFDILDIR